MHDSGLADPYLTPRTQPARNPLRYVVFSLILAVILLTALAASMMVWWSIRPSRVELQRVPAIERFPIDAYRSPVNPTGELPPSTFESVAP
jgi:hypothetical protein